MSSIEGVYKKTIFKSNTNGYLIALFKVVKTSPDLTTYQNKTITITGYLPDLNEIDTYNLEGNLTTHPKYGEQFMVQNIMRILPKETDAIINVLTSNLFKGIGKKTAIKIVDMFKEKTFSTILDHPSDLLLIKGLSEKQVKVLHDSLVNYQGSYEIILNLTKLGFNTKDSLKIYSKYKEESFTIINDDIYRAYYDIDEIKYSVCDNIFLKNNQDNPLDIKRIRATFLYILRELTNKIGSTYYYLENITPYLHKLLKQSITDSLLLDSINSLIALDLIVVKENKIYLKEYFDAIIFVARRLRLLAHEKTVSKDYSKYLDEIELKNHITYNPEQKEAIQKAITSKCLVITGGPGTGKTTIIKGIIDLYTAINNYKPKNLDKTLALLAPTGRAAKRMSLSSDIKASTIHRFLKWNKDNNKFQVNEYNKSEVEFLIVDEASMIDILLLSNLLKGLSSNCKIIFVGDVNQLPSVGAGNVLSDIITSKEIDVIELKNLYRQGKDSNIITFAHDINNGKVDNTLFNQSDDLIFIDAPDNEVLKVIKKEASKIPLEDLQVLAPLYKGPNGIDNINEILGSLYNKTASKSIVINDVTYKEHDKVIQLTNMPDDNVFNGDIGTISKIKITPHKEVYIDFDDNTVKYTPTTFNNFTHAYAISIHKSQGSEFKTVIMPLVKGYHNMLYRKLIYTGVTRSKEKLILIGDKDALLYAINNTSERKRETSLAKYLKDGII